VSEPAQIKIRHADKRLDLAYEDGSTLSFPAEFLRVQPPAGPGRAELVPGKRLVSILAAEPAGTCALRLKFSDGYESASYSWEYLRELGREQHIRWRRYLHSLEQAGLGRD
jgi:DUF971 family protein